MEKKTTITKDGTKIESYSLSEEQHNIAVRLVTENLRKIDNYTLEEVEDEETVNIWIADAYAEGEEDYVDFLRNAIVKGATIYTLKSHCGWAQPIGDVVVY